MVSNGDALTGTCVVSPATTEPSPSRALSTPLTRPASRSACMSAEAPNASLSTSLATGADALELDFKTEAQAARDVLAGRATFIGNLDPTSVLAMGSTRDVEDKTRELLRIFAGTPGFILNAGCAIPATTPPDNIRTMIRLAREGVKRRLRRGFTWRTADSQSRLVMKPLR